MKTINIITYIDIKAINIITYIDIKAINVKNFIEIKAWPPNIDTNTKKKNSTNTAENGYDGQRAMSRYTALTSLAACSLDHSKAIGADKYRNRWML
jgi:hypothetical protein